MFKISFNKKLISCFIIFFVLSSCAKEGFFKTGDARKNPPDPKLRVKKNLEEGRGFRLNNIGGGKGGDFEFASSNELWRASLDILDFMPLTSANYSGGIIITDWYTENNNPGDSIKITIRFLVLIFRQLVSLLRINQINELGIQHDSKFNFEESFD